MLNRVNSQARAAAATLLLALLCLCSAISSSSDATGASAMPGSVSNLLTVDQSGKGDHRTIQDAINAVPANSSAATVIRIRPGVYRQVTETDHYIFRYGG
jgi:pectinesterase